MTLQYNSLKFAANISWLFLEFPFLERFYQAKQAGFDAVECLIPYIEPAEKIKQILQQQHLDMVLINVPMGNAPLERGFASLPDRINDFREGIELALDYAITLSCHRIHVLSGNRNPHIELTHQYQQLVENMRYAADKFNRHNIKLLIEPLNPIDMVGYMISDLQAANQLIHDIGRDNVALQFDMYHCQKTQGNLLYNFNQFKHQVAHIQIASAPNRQEPDKGEINYPWLFQQLELLGYDQWIGCEYKPEHSTLVGLDWFKKIKRYKQ